MYRTGTVHPRIRLPVLLCILYSYSCRFTGDLQIQSRASLFSARSESNPVLILLYLFETGSKHTLETMLETPQFLPRNQRTPTMKVTALALMLIVAPTDVMAGPFCKDSPMCRMCYDMHVL